MHRLEEGHFGQPSAACCLRRVQLKPVCLSLIASALLVALLVASYSSDEAVVKGYVVAGGFADINEHLINVSSLSKTQQRRQQLIASVCSQHQRLRLPGRSWRYKMDKSHRLMYCPIPKAGWSSWKRLLFYINGAINSTDVEIGITPDSKAGVLDVSLLGVQRMLSTQSMFLFAFVRDPWRRLVSAYINKALDWNYTRILHTPCRWETMEPYKEPITFSQFLTCIADAGGNIVGLDIHWAPMWQLCDFCRLHYAFIGHLETVDEDADYIIKKNGLNVTFPRIFSSKAHHADEIIESWYALVPADVIQRLRTLYAYDFQLHGYSDIPPGWKDKLS